MTYAVVLALALAGAPVRFPPSVVVLSLLQVPSCALLLPWLRSPPRPGPFPGRSGAAETVALWRAPAKPYNSRLERTLARVVQARGVAGARPSAVRGAVAAPRPARPSQGRPTPPRRPRRRARPARLSSAWGAIRSPRSRPGDEPSATRWTKLRFLRRSLERYEALDERLQAVPGAPLRWLAYRVTGVEEARPLFSANPWGALDPPRRRRRAPPAARPAGRRTPRPLLRGGGGRPRAGRLPAREARPAGSRRLPRAGGARRRGRSIRRRAGSPPRGSGWSTPGAGFELYSNGLRIDTT